jgi:hypothetical protein
MWLAYLSLIGGTLVLGLIFVPIDPAKTVPFIFSNNTLPGRAWNLMIDYGIRLGLLSLFLPVGILAAFQKDRGRERRLIHFLLVPLLMFTLPLSVYSSVLFLPVFGYYSVVGFDTVRSSYKNRWIGLLSVVFVLVFAAIYMRFVVVIPLWTIGLVVATTFIMFLVVIQAVRMWVSYQTVAGKQLRRWKTAVGRGPMNLLDWQGIRIFLVSLIVISLITTEGVLLQSDYKYVTSDERLVIEYLGDHPPEGIVFVPTTVLGRRLIAYGFKAVLSFNDDATLYFEWVDPSNITANSHLSIMGLLLSGRLYSYDGPDVEKEIWEQFFTINLTTQTGRDYAVAHGLEYVIVEKDDDGYSNVFYSIYGEYESTLLWSAPLACSLVVDGEILSLFRVSS